MGNEHHPSTEAPFRELRLPSGAELAGYSALIRDYGLSVPLPRILHATGKRRPAQAGWRISPPAQAPRPTFAGQLTFAMKREGLDLAVLKRLFMTLDAAEVRDLVLTRPTGSYARRIWFLYEWLSGRQLDLPEARAGKYVCAVDPAQQWAIPGKNSRRHRVRNNLPGTPEFCPLVFRTPVLQKFVSLRLAQQARAMVANVQRDLLARAAAFLLRKDSRASYEIEGESPPQERIMRWGMVLGSAGQQGLDVEELLRLQRIVIGDARLVSLGLRQEGGFVGEHARTTRLPLPGHSSARPDDVPALVDGILAFGNGAALHLDPVIAAAVLAFGFVYVHPFVDGNGRLHRYLIHHVLAQGGFNPPGAFFPVSSVILDRLDEYLRVLEQHSRSILPLIEWEPTARFNVQVCNDTGDLYRFFDATPHAEFLYACVQQAVEKELPEETLFLRRYDTFREQVNKMIDMPDRLIDLLFRFLHQNGGQLSARARQKEFEALTEAEVRHVEGLYQQGFGTSAPPRA